MNTLYIIIINILSKKMQKSIGLAADHGTRQHGRPFLPSLPFPVYWPAEAGSYLPTGRWRGHYLGLNR